MTIEKERMMKKVLPSLLFNALILVYPITGMGAPTQNVFGVWGSLTLQGDFSFLSSDFDRIKWIVMNQSRTRDDSPKGSRFSENLLFSQVGYQMTNNASLWVGYVHNWLHPLNRSAFQENRPYEDFLWKQKFDDITFMARTRLEQRINQTTGDTGHRARQFFQISHPLPIENLSLYVGDEVFFYLNKTSFGKHGFTENRVFSGLSYNFNKMVGFDLGYMGQYVDNATGSNLFTHNVQANLRFAF